MPFTHAPESIIFDVQLENTMSKYITINVTRIVSDDMHIKVNDDFNPNSLREQDIEHFAQKYLPSNLFRWTDRDLEFQVIGPTEREIVEEFEMESLPDDI